MDPFVAAYPFDTRIEGNHPSPLTFDRVYMGHITTSSLPVFNLPVELFPLILRQLSSQDLKSLSMTDRDCWKLSSIVQYRHLRMAFTQTSSEVLQAFLRGPSRPEHRYIRHCVRRMDVGWDTDIRIHSDAALLCRLSAPSLIEIDLVKMLGSPIRDYLMKIVRMVATSLPNVHILDWDLPFAIPSSILECLLSSPLHHARLRGPVVEDGASTFITVACPTQLETLSLDVFRPHDGSQPLQLIQHILKQTACTIRQLIWTGQAVNETIILDGMPSFPHLRLVTIDRIASECDQLLDALLGQNTRVRSLSMDSATLSTCKFYRVRGHMSTLRAFGWINKFDASLSYDDITRFLSDNTHLESIHLSDGLPYDFMDDVFLPLLRDNFISLTSLKLVGPTSNINVSSLALIASIPSLRHLWLSAGNQESVRNTWEVDIDETLSQLSPLHHLQTLAFSKDTYKVIGHPLSLRFCDYYASKALPPNFVITKYLSPSEFEDYELGGKDIGFDEAVSHQISLRCVAWERWHANEMLSLAEKCSGVFKRLTWCFLGQLAFSVSDEYWGRNVTLDSSCREPHFTSLRTKMSLGVWCPN